MVDDVLHPSEVGVAFGRDAIFPTLVIRKSLSAPVRDVERRVGEDEVGLEVGMAVVVKAVAVRDLALDAAYCEVHLG